MLCFILIDVRLKPQEIDIEFINWIGKLGIPIAIVFTKADKLSKSKVLTSIIRFKNELKNYWEELPAVFISSSVTREGREEILKYIYEINELTD